MPKINVIGTSGSGKSTFSRKLASNLNIPYIEMDRLWWGSNWTPVSDELFFDRVKVALQKEKWILDGNYSRTLPIKWKDVKYVIWIDYSFIRTLYQVVMRAINRAWTQMELWEGTGNRESFKRGFLSKESIILWMITTHKPVREKYEILTRDPQYSHIKFIRVKSRKEAESLLENASQIFQE